MFEPKGKKRNVCVRFNFLFNFVRFVPSTYMLSLGYIRQNLSVEDCTKIFKSHVISKISYLSPV